VFSVKRDDSLSRRESIIEMQLGSLWFAPNTHGLSRS